ncbi:hypothetical protein CXG81DRAFT_27342 [Caulochytrium protostelioides]|uniref:Uncharacterized protein n=1 Tax=Caulochytrium protostelioides TaxID=1555241 RepID=A0A4P9X4B8_9FUNG|nr:hypothetical protein CXG81DRAFT_27342 [Caulochytrium protostelioides]|eukprot:RKO99916.1 hypothetical protein CXG81DRAFT_27342 [Caulochytrium protostelioides]
MASPARLADGAADSERQPLLPAGSPRAPSSAAGSPSSSPPPPPLAGYPLSVSRTFSVLLVIFTLSMLCTSIASYLPDLVRITHRDRAGGGGGGGTGTGARFSATLGLRQLCIVEDPQTQLCRRFPEGGQCALRDPAQPGWQGWDLPADVCTRWLNLQYVQDAMLLFGGVAWLAYVGMITAVSRLASVGIVAWCTLLHAVCGITLMVQVVRTKRDTLDALRRGGLPPTTQYGYAFSLNLTAWMLDLSLLVALALTLLLRRRTLLTPSASTISLAPTPRD